MTARVPVLTPARPPRSAAPTARRWPGRLVALVLGALPAVAFPAPALWWLAPVALVPFLLVLRAAPTAREGFWRGWLGVTGYLIAGNAFLIPSVTVFIVPLGLALAALYIPFSLLAWHLLRRPDSVRRVAAALILPASAWVLADQVRSWRGLGGPWGLLGSSQWNDRPLLQVAALGGVAALTWMLVSVNMAVAVALAPRVRPGHRWLALAVGGGLLVAGAGWGVLRPAIPAAGTMRLAVVQPGVLPSNAERFAAQAALTRAAAPDHPQLVVWGESSEDVDPSTHRAYLVRTRALAREVHADVLVNVDAGNSELGPGSAKTSVLVGPTGVRATYAKMRLVPFGEYIPFRSVLGWLDRFTKASQINRVPGRHLVLMQTSGVRFGPLICFEIAFSDMSRDLARMGAQVIVVQTATSTFQGTWGPAQSASLAALRAVESGRSVVQAALTGVSTVFDASGHELAWFPTSQRGVLLVDVPLARTTTPFDTYGDWVVLLSAIALVLGGIVALVGSAARRGQIGW